MEHLPDPVRVIAAARTVVVDDQQRVLLIRRSDNRQWALPAGHMDPGESVTDCAVRELQEETGLHAETLRAFAVYSEPRFRSPSRSDTQMLTVAFRVDGWSGEVQKRTNETLDARWFPLEEARKLPDLMPMYLEAIEDCFSHAGDFIVK